MSLASVLLVVAAVAVSVHAGDYSALPIKKVVVLMMENRALDHFLGHLNRDIKDFDGIPSNAGNFKDPSDPHSEFYPINEHPYDKGPDDPCHSYDCIKDQIYSGAGETGYMEGFAANALSLKHSVANTLSTWNSTTLPVMYSLAREFAVFDKWHCSAPTPTNPNREYIMSGTSHGAIDNTIPHDGFPQRTHFDLLSQHNVSWKIYYSDNPWGALFFSSLRKSPNVEKVVPIETFWGQAASGNLPQYSFIEPRMATSKNGPSNWQHPDNSVSEGERLYKRVYETLRNSPEWNNTLLMVTYDEHGGFYDHVLPPHEGIPSPDGIKAPNGFNFDRLGIRVPAIAISPWIAAQVVHNPNEANTYYESTSIISTVNEIFGITDHLTKRDAWSGKFTYLLRQLKEPRTDCPKTLPAVNPLSQEDLIREGQLPPNHHHTDQVAILCEMNHRNDSYFGCREGDLKTQYEVGEFMMSEWSYYRKHNI